jgi:hypothetical protein
MAITRMNAGFRSERVMSLLVFRRHPEPKANHPQRQSAMQMFVARFASKDPALMVTQMRGVFSFASARHAKHAMA